MILASGENKKIKKAKSKNKRVPKQKDLLTTRTFLVIKTFNNVACAKIGRNQFNYCNFFKKVVTADSYHFLGMSSTTKQLYF